MWLIAATQYRKYVNLKNGVTAINSEYEYGLVLAALEKIDSQKVVEWLHKTDIRTKNSDETRGSLK